MKILVIDVINGTIGYRSCCQKDRAMACTNFDMFLRQLNEHLKNLYNVGKIKLRAK